MSWWNALLPVIGSVAGSLINAGSNKRRQDDSNEFNAAEAQKNRDFQAQQAEIARQWQEDYYNQYQSPEAMVRQYENAGINPVLATGASPVTPPSASSPQGSTASSVQPYYQDPSTLISTFMQLKRLKSEIDNIDADTDQKRYDSQLKQSQILYNTSLTNLTNHQVEKVKEDLRLVAVQASNEEYKRNILEIEKDIAELQRNQDLDERAFYNKYGFYPNDSLSAAIVKLADRFGNSFVKFFVDSFTTLNNHVTLMDYKR